MNETMMSIIDTSPTELRADRMRLAYLIGGLAGVHWKTALGAIEHGAKRVRSKRSRARIVDAAEKLGIELP